MKNFHRSLKGSFTLSSVSIQICYLFSCGLKAIFSSGNKTIIAYIETISAFPKIIKVQTVVTINPHDRGPFHLFTDFLVKNGHTNRQDT